MANKLHDVDPPLESSGGGTVIEVGQTIRLSASATLDNNARIAVSKNSGAVVGTRRKLNLIEGANVTLTVADDAGGEKVDVTIAAAAGGGGASATTIETDLGPPKTSGKFTIVDAAITAAKKVLIWQAPGPYTGKGTLADEAEMDGIDCLAIPGSGQAVVGWRVRGGFRPAIPLAEGNVDRQAASTLAPPQDDPQSRNGLAVLGKVKGNFKFSYVVFA